MRLTLAVSVLLVAACDSNNKPAAAPLRPLASNVTVRANETNALSAVVAFTASNLNSARVLVSGAGEETATPESALVDGGQEITVLGLLPETDYLLTLEYSGLGETQRAAGIGFRTAALPAALKDRVEVRPVGASSGGYTLTNLIGRDPALHYVLAFDDRGRIRWYRQFTGLGAFAEQMPNGNYMTFIGTTTGFQEDYGYFQEFTPGGKEVARHEAPRPYYTDNHEILFTPAAGGGWTSHLLTYSIRDVDLSRVFAGGQTNVRLAGHQIMRFKPSGALEYTWDAWTQMRIEDWIEEPAADRLAAAGDFDHPNSLTFDLDGNYVASFRNSAEITKIDATTGQMIWRFGGNQSQFQILGDPLGKFCGQHSVQVLSNGHLLLFDNGLRHSPQQSRAVEYRLDVAARTATMVWEFRYPRTTLYAPFTGSVQRLANGNTAVGYAFRGVACEVDPAGNMIWDAALVVDGNSAITYRMKRIESLYNR